MIASDNKPVIFLAFANDRDDTVGYLRQLPQETRRLRKALKPAEKAGLCEVVVRSNSTAADLFEVFQDPKYRNRIAILHYGGHANGYQLLLESATGESAAADAGGLAAFLAQQQGLQLVFLNGCSTQAQTRGLLDAGISAVISTSRSINDQVATDFAHQFYQGLAGGATLRTCYNEAEATGQTAKGSNTRALYIGRPQDAQNRPEEDRLPWSLYLRQGADSADQWNLPEAVDDPLFGLPELPEQDLPESPYRNLNWFTRNDAEVFFGRGHQIRELYDLLITPRSAPILLFYGQSGVGKSSILDAGLIPRLQRDYEVCYLRRNEQGLLVTLQTAFVSEGAGRPVDTAWRAQEERLGKPLIVFLDQVEELYTRPLQHLPDELEQLLCVLEATFSDSTRRPKGKLVMGFRKEWLAELEARMAEHEIPRSRVFLEPLDRRGIIEVVQGPTTSERLRERYGLTVEAGLAEIIADDLLEDSGSAIAPTLQVLLTKLWARATRENYEHPHFSNTLYQDLKREGILLGDFLAQQIAAVRERFPEAVDSGLLLDLLAQHTTALGTADQCRMEQLHANYAHTGDLLPELLQECLDLYLLTMPVSSERDSVKMMRLAHDTLAPLVRQRFEESDKPGQRARRILDSRSVDWANGQSGAALDETDVETVEAGQPGMRVLNEDERRLIDASREERARRNRNRRILRLGAMAAMVIIVFLGITGWYLRQQALLSEREAVRRSYISTALRVAESAPRQRGQDETGSDRRWLLLARQAYLFNERHDGQASGTIGKLLQDAIRLGMVATFVTRSGGGHIVFSPNGRMLASGGRDGTISLWPVDDPNGKPTILSGHERAVVDVAFSPDGHILASGGLDGTVRLWPLDDTGGDPTVLTGHSDKVYAVDFSPDGRMLASASEDTTIRLWRLEDPGGELTVLTGHERGVITVAFSPDSRMLASGGWEHEVRLWRLDLPGSKPEIVPGHTSQITSVAFSPDGRILASTGLDNTVHLWPLDDSGSEPTVLTGNELFVVFSPNGHTLASGDANASGGSIRLWPLDDLGGEPTVFAGFSRASSVAFSPDGGMLASSDMDGAVRLWPIGTLGSWQTVLTGHEAPVASVAFSPDGRILASGGVDGTVRLWSLDSSRGEPMVLRGHENGVFAMDFSPDGRILASADMNCTVFQWSLDDPGGEPTVLARHENGFFPMGFSPDDRTLACANSASDGTIHLWPLDAPGGEPTVLNASTSPLRALAFSPDGRILASGGTDRTVRLWPLDDPGGEPTIITGHDKRVRSLAFSPDSQILAAGTYAATVILWLLDNSGGEPTVFSGHEQLVTAVAFSPDGRRLASASDDGTVRLWPLDDPGGEPTVSTVHKDEVYTVAFSPDGRTLASAGKEGTIRILLVDIHALADEICARVDRNLTPEEWDLLVGAELPYERTCPNLPEGVIKER